MKIKTQEELDCLPLDTNGDIDIIGGTEEKPINITKHYPNADIRLKENSVVNLFNDAVIFDMWDNSTVLNMCGNSRVEEMHDGTTVQNMHDNSTVKRMWSNSSIQSMHDNSRVENAWGYSSIENMHDNASVKKMYWHSIVKTMYNNSTVKEMRGYSSIQNMQDNATVIVCSSNVNVTANGNNTINVSKHLESVPGITVNETSKIVKIDTFYSNPTPELFVQHYNIPVIDGKVLLYKAVHKNNDGVYYSNWDNNFTYKIGETITNDCDTDVNEDCSFGLHVGTLGYANEFGEDLDDGVILECEVELSKLVVPIGCDGNVRTSEIKIIREIK